MKQGRLTIYTEAELLSARTGLKKTACLQWMKAEGVNSVLDLKSKWPDLTHPQAMAKAEMEITRFICGGN